MRHLSIKIPKQWMDELIKRAKEHGHNKSSYVRWLIEKDLKEKK